MKIINLIFLSLIVLTSHAQKPGWLNPTWSVLTYEAEADYNHDGSWGKGYMSANFSTYWLIPSHAKWRKQFGVAKRPLCRQCATRILAYLNYSASTSQNKKELEFANNGLQYLLGEQMQNGAFHWWWTPEGKGQLGKIGLLLETGLSGRAMIYGYKAFGKKEYLASSDRAVNYILGEAEKPIPVPNYAAFALLCLSGYADVTKDTNVLNKAITIATRDIISKQLPTGAWPDHDSYIHYHGIILLALESLYDASAMHQETISKETRQSILKSINKGIDYIESLIDITNNNIKASYLNNKEGSPFLVTAAISWSNISNSKNNFLCQKLYEICYKDIKRKGGMMYNAEWGICYPWSDYKMWATSIISYKCFK